jgi:hypothetical protein
MVQALPQLMNKQEAIRRLIHAAIRMIVAEEDPFAIHLLIQSADKTSIDLAKRLGRELRVDWTLYIKDEFQKEFFEKHRAIYNYFKHGNRDFDQDLVIENIMTRNLMDLYILIANYNSLFKEKTHHMVLFQIFVLQVYPKIVIPPDHLKETFEQGAKESQHLTPRDFLKRVEDTNTLPNYFLESFRDRQILGDFYSLTFGEIRAGVTESPRKFKIPG